MTLKLEKAWNHNAGATPADCLCPACGRIGAHRPDPARPTVLACDHCGLEYCVPPTAGDLAWRYNRGKSDKDCMCPACGATGAHREPDQEHPGIVCCSTCDRQFAVP